MPLALLALALALSTPCPPASRPLLAEVLYDAAGDDSGHEFVELLNPGPAPFPLAGLRIEAGDGSGPGRWTLRWTAAATDTIGPGARFVVGGARVTPAPQAIVTLDLQNGPDAVRLVWPDGASETLGYGAHELAEYACGEPAPDAASGTSLARTPDHAASGDNAADFRPATPSPGAPNVAARNLAVARGSLGADPGSPAPGAPFTASGGVVNAGLEPAPAASVTVSARLVASDGAAHGAGDLVIPAALAPGDSFGFAMAARSGEAGAYWLVVDARHSGDQNPRDDADSIRVRVGPGPLGLSEIQFHPAAMEGEWVEVRNQSDAPLDLAAFTLLDRSGAAGRVAPGPPLLPDSFAVLAQDPAALRRRYPGLDSTRVREARPWPALNNLDDDGGIADVVTLREADGTPSDAHAYGARGVPAGTPLERRDGGWWPSRDPAGSPLAGPRPFAAPAGRFAVEPRLIREGARARCRWSLPWPRARIRVELLDLAGRAVPGTATEFTAPATGERELDVAAAGPGLYAVTLRARAEGGSEDLVELRPLRIAGPVR